MAPARALADGPRQRAPALLVLVTLAFLSAGVGCGSGTPSGKPVRAAHSTVCGPDETREYFCDDLLPLSETALSPPPYQNCPSSIDGPTGQYDPPPSLGFFDASYTEYTRRRAPPGHSCCYSWCQKLTLANPDNPAVQASCATPTAFREEYCTPEPEAGTTASAGDPFDRCPVAIVPPAKAVFSSPPAALLDLQITATRRGKGQADCCYAWCSQAPPGSGLRK